MTGLHAAPGTLDFRCDECQVRFAAGEGGVCARCHRTLCARHLRGWLASLLPPLALRSSTCLRCRAK